VSPYHVEYQNRFPGALVGFPGKGLAKIVDGTSNTLMLSELRTRAHLQDQRGAWALPWNACTQLAFDMHDMQSPVNLAGGAFTPNPASLGVTQQPNEQGPNVDMLYRCPDPASAQLEKMPCNVWVEGTPQEYLSSAPRSRHPGGVNVVFVDGHLGFLPNTVDEMAMTYLIYIRDHVTVSPSDHVF
jgi:prepilin-type processing-associated H-X9-DG protein